MIEALRRVAQRLHDPLEVMWVCVRWYAASPLGFRQIEEIRGECGVFVGHSTLHRWWIRISPMLAVGTSWRMDETYVKVGGQWKYLYRAVDKDGDTIDKSGPNTAAVVSIQADSGLAIETRKSKHPNNLVEQDHRAIKRITRSMLGFKRFRCARILLAGIETMHMIREGQLGAINDQASSPTNQFYSLAF